MARDKVSETCELIMEINVYNPSLGKMIHPISKKKAILKNDKMIVTDNFSEGFIKKIWEKNPDVLKQHVFIDKELLKKSYRGIDPKKNIGSGFSFGKLSGIDEIGADIDNDTVKKITKMNGGWFALKPSEVATSRCIPDPSEDDAEACLMVTILGKFQDGETYNMKRKIIPEKKGDGILAIRKEDILGKIDYLKKITGTTDPIDDTAYAIGTFIEIPLQVWVKTGNKIKKGLVQLKKEIELSNLGEKGRISTYDDLKRWTSNIVNEGKGSENFIQELPFKLDISIPETSSLIKNEHVDVKGGSKSQAFPMNSVVLLLDHDENIIPIEKYNGKKETSRTIDEVIGKTDKSLLSKWKWVAVPIYQKGEKTIIPKQVLIRRSISNYPSGGTYFTSTEEMSDAVQDAAKISWNLLSRSTEMHDSIRYKTKGMGAIGDGILKQSREISGGTISSSFERFLFSKEATMFSDMNSGTEFPFMAGRRIPHGSDGLTKEMKSLIKEDHAVGIETDFKKVANKCS